MSKDELLVSAATPLKRPTTRQSRLNRKLLLASGILGLMILLAAFGPIVYPVDPNLQNILNRLAPPSANHPFGTDEFGRDVLARTFAALRLDLPVGVLGAVIPLSIGGMLGLLSAWLGGWIDSLLMRLGDLVMAFPTYVLVIALIALMGPGIPSLLAAFAIVGWVPYFRLTRSEVQRVRTEDYFSAAVLGGVRFGSLLFRHVLPNAVRPLLAFVAIDIMTAILVLASFSYLGMGIQPPTAELGAMIGSGQPYVQIQWWLTLVPGAFIAIIGTGFLLLGEFFEERLRG